MDPDNNNDLKIKQDKPIKIVKILGLFVFLFIISCYLLAAPIDKNKTMTTVIHISSNDTLSSIANDLKDKNVIKSSFFLKSFVSLFKSDKRINKGDYSFNRYSPVFVVAWQLAEGHHNINPIKITLREGLTNQQIAKVLADKLYNFDKDLFLEKVKNKQGYLFPDTYFFFPMDTVGEVIVELSSNFSNQIKRVQSFINLNEKSLPDIIIMASIIEKEALGEEDASLISGILWKRIRLGIALQVDVDKSTYKNKGLPSTPISNPGLVSIRASLEPTSSSYLYYLHDKKGIVHFAKNFEQHKQNISKYLR